MSEWFFVEQQPGFRLIRGCLVCMIHGKADEAIRDMCGPQCIGGAGASWRAGRVARMRTPLWTSSVISSRGLVAWTKISNLLLRSSVGLPELILDCIQLLAVVSSPRWPLDTNSGINLGLFVS
jgi:hypothetical protein